MYEIERLINKDRSMHLLQLPALGVLLIIAFAILLEFILIKNKLDSD